jgi:hypothetical protein
MRTNSRSSSSAIVAMMLRFWLFPAASAALDLLEMVGWRALSPTCGAPGPNSLESVLKPMVNNQQLSMSVMRRNKKGLGDGSVEGI